MRAGRWEGKASERFILAVPFSTRSCKRFNLAVSLGRLCFVDVVVIVVKFGLLLLRIGCWVSHPCLAMSCCLEFFGEARPCGVTGGVPFYPFSVLAHEWKRHVLLTVEWKKSWLYKIDNVSSWPVCVCLLIILVYINKRRKRSMKAVRWKGKAKDGFILPFVL